MMMSHGYNPFWSEGSIKPPLFQTSTFEFASAQAGKAFFAKAYGIEENSDPMGLIYSRLNNPNLEIFETRLRLWDGTESCAAFESGMAAISTTLMTFAKPGSAVLCSMPVYGGTNHFLQHILAGYGVDVFHFYPNQTKKEIEELIVRHGIANRLSIIYTESPANPTIQLVDIEMCSEIAKQCSFNEEQTLLAVDNTFMGPVWQHPNEHGADLILYSATKYIGGHSDLIAGAVLGSQEHMNQVKAMRTFLGNMASPHTSWLLCRSLETLQIRMEKQAENAKQVAQFLREHSLVNQVFYLDEFIDARQEDIFNRHCSSTGAMISFTIKGGEKEAFQFLDSLTLIKLAVSLGGTESLAEHPCSMTHTDMPYELKQLAGVTEDLLRISVGIEHPQDLIDDLAHAFDMVQQNLHTA